MNDINVVYTIWSKGLIMLMQLIVKAISFRLKKKKL